MVIIVQGGMIEVCWGLRSFVPRDGAALRMTGTEEPKSGTGLKAGHYKGLDAVSSVYLDLAPEKAEATPRAMRAVPEALRCMRRRRGLARR
jgi:hypothetical protein